jgi:Fe-S oxidoreductase
MVTNEGNGRLVTTLPRVHVALIGMEKLVPTLEEALTALLVLPRNATSQRLTSYVSWIGGATEYKGAEGGKKAVHFIFLDNGRTRLAEDPVCSQVLHCVRCGACANVCPVYRLVGGHKMGHIYIGAIGIILSYFFFGRDKARVLAHNCVGCEACADICAAHIELPRMIREVRARLAKEEGVPLGTSLIGSVMKNRTLFHTLLKFAKYAQRPVTGGAPFLRHLPQVFARGHDFKALPALAPESFREMWEKVRPRLPAPRSKVALFSGCAQDFVYPEQLKACVELLSAHNVEVDFPLRQTCCGLPLDTMGLADARSDVAAQNLEALDASRYDAVITLCASCAAYLKQSYPQTLAGTPLENRAGILAEKVMDFSSYVHDVLGLDERHFVNAGEKTAYHASCHLCRGLGVKDAPRALIRAGADYVQAAEEELCCGFGGGYSVKFPEISSQLLEKKLEAYAASGASRLVADCPGCIIQLRGGAEKKGMPLRVSHMAELLAERAKRP